jgi:hypothetical protein
MNNAATQTGANTMKATSIRNALSDEFDYYTRTIRGTDTSRKSAVRIVRILDRWPWANNLPHDRDTMIRREAQGLPPVE